MQRRVSLWIQVHHADLFPTLSQGCCQVDGSGGFSNTTFLVDDSYFSHQKIPESE
jgi:hypothetical protein